MIGCLRGDTDNTDDPEVKEEMSVANANNTNDLTPVRAAMSTGTIEISDSLG